MKLSRCYAALLIAIAPTIVGSTVPQAAAQVAPAADAQPDDAAMDFARAYLDSAVYVAGFRRALHAQVAACLAAKQFTADQAAEKNALNDRFMDAWEPEFPAMQGKIAATMRSAFDDVQMTELDTFYRSPVGRKMVALVVDQIVELMAKSMPVCGSPLPPMDKEKLAEGAMGKLSDVELNELAAFGASDTGHKFRDFQPTLMAVFGPLIRESRTKALEAAGLKKVSQ